MWPKYNKRHNFWKCWDFCNIYPNRDFNKLSSDTQFLTKLKWYLEIQLLQTSVFPFIFFIIMWHDRGKWVTCRKMSIHRFLCHFLTSFWCKPHWNCISGYRVTEIWTLFLLISQNHYFRHPTHSPCHIFCTLFWSWSRNKPDRQDVPFVVPGVTNARPTLLSVDIISTL